MDGHRGIARSCVSVPSAEVVFFSAPLVAWIVIQSVRRVPSYKAAIPGVVLGGAVFAALFLWHSYAMTGNPLLPARFANPQNLDVQSPSVVDALRRERGL